MSGIQRIVMVAYTSYPSDPRVRREAEALAILPDKKVTVLTNKESDVPRTYILQGVEVQELNYKKYQGNSNVKYVFILSDVHPAGVPSIHEVGPAEFRGYRSCS